MQKGSAFRAFCGKNNQLKRWHRRKVGTESISREKQELERFLNTQLIPFVDHTFYSTVNIVHYRETLFGNVCGRRWGAVV